MISSPTRFMRLSRRSILTLTLCTLFMASVRLTAVPNFDFAFSFSISPGFLTSSAVFADSTFPDNAKSVAFLISDTFSIFSLTASLSASVESNTLKLKSNFSSSRSSNDGMVLIMSPSSDMLRITRVERAAFKRQDSSRNTSAINTDLPLSCAFSISAL